MSREYQNVSLSIEPELLERARQRARKLGFKNSFSAYVQLLIEEDLKAAKHLLMNEESPPPTPPKRKGNPGSARYT